MFEAAPTSGVFPEAWPLPRRDRGLCHSPLLGARDCGVGTRGAADAGALCEGLRQRGKNDAADAEAICEAVQRPTMRFVSLKSPEQQSVLMLHRTRELLVRQRTMLVNALRAHMAEFGIVTRVGLPQIKELLAVIADKDDHRLPPDARACLESLGRQFLSVHEEICAADRRLHAWHRSDPVSQRLATIPGVGPVTASALAASIADPSVFKSGREMAAWIGLVPRQNSTGGKQRLGKISKQGDHYLRWLLVAGAMTVIRHARRRGTQTSPGSMT